MESHTLTHRTYQHEALMRYAKLLGCSRIDTRLDPETGLHAIIAINSTALGPAIGGCRCHSYRAAGAALKDALRLSYMMTLKSAFSDLPHGGAKAVILAPRVIKDRNAYFRSFGDFVHQLNGSYITAVDVGTSTDDMDIIAERTPYVIGAAKVHQSERDPSPCTALGVLRGIQAAVAFRLKRDSLEEIHVAIQGAGHVGYHLARGLHELGAKITLCDVNTQAVQRCVEEFGAHAVEPEAIYDIPCDVFSPCALGGVINGETLHRISAPIIAGAANNQLAHHLLGQLLHQRGILYAPDFVINAGGLISAATDYAFRDMKRADEKINVLYDNMLALFERAARDNQPTTYVAELIALEKIKAEQLKASGMQ